MQLSNYHSHCTFCDGRSTPEDFVNGMKQLVDLLPGLDSKQIKASLSEYRWDNIVNDYLRPLLDSYDN